MVYISDLQPLINSWQERLHNQYQPTPYKDALSECIYDLNQCINNSIDRMTEEDAFFANLEPDDFYAAAM